ncbi:hypothetical protein NMG60_11022188 [Bertholletia excelsa]
MIRGKFHQLVLYAVSVILLTGNPSLQLPCMGAKRQALLRFKQVLVDDYGRLSYWEGEEDCCKWREVGCSNRTGHVTVLDLRAPFSPNVGYKYLKGNLSPLLLELQHLTYLDLSGNQFMKLQYLNLSFAGFSRPIPNEFQNLSKLQYLSSNFFLSSGKLEWLSHLSQNLNLGFNRLEGVLPKSFANLSHLQSLYLSGNNIKDEFSKILHKLSRVKNSLKTLDFAFNQVGGSFFDFTGFTSLIELNLCYNQLSGSFPETFAQIIPNLVFLDLSGNQITGSLPDLSVFLSLTNLELGNNHLNGTVHEKIGLLSKLEVLDASFNLLEGVISEAHFSNLSNLFNVLDIFSTKISGNLPSWFWDLPPNVDYLNVSYNQISGIVPDLSSKFHGFPGMDLSFNQFTGPIPLFPSNVTFLNFSKNKFVGSLAFLCTITGEQLGYLDLSSNLLSGELPECWVQFSSPVGNLHLRDNEFQGEVPSLKNCTLLKIIDLSTNRRTGEIPAWIGTHLPSLIVLSLKSNGSQNSLSGKIPGCVDNFIALVQVNSSDPLIDFRYKTYEGSFYDGSSYVGNALVQWKGHELEYRNTLGLLKSIDLSSNKLQGEIPQQIETLAGLSGEISKSFAQLNYQSVLDLSDNNLSGRIPCSTQLQSFNASSFEGNPGLCGVPLPIKCPGDETIDHGKQQKLDENEDEGELITLGFYISVGLGFIVGF